ncbi:iron(III) transport system permease protein [Alteribacillus persepolensis]|uniref:Iron(III) transport system permease protein n=1 Tax=Alteribacillus persepolensis TaxID=568899 RepID=A0A1G8G4E8_9BACI|nr:iron ABC transporter permease [Alteribacillus persepolensis]SDH89272.1 iron(III) transport system permease protein [Alteribacillus persepolensis]
MKFKHIRPTTTSGWGAAAVFLVAILILPTLFLLVRVFQPASENWDHIREFMLKDYFVDTISIAVWTGLFSVAVGTTLAWLVSAYDFPFRKTLKWALLLPLAIPPYIGAYTYHGILDYTGVVQMTLRNTFGLELSQAYFDIMHIPGAVFIFTIFLYPYVYAITRAFFASQATSLIESARVLGSGPVQTFFRVVLPVSRAAIVAGVSLVVLEVLNDYGVVSYFGIQTFSTAIFQTWFSFGDIDAAIKLAGILMAIVMFILLLEKFLRGRRKFSYSTTKVKPLKPVRLYGWKKAVVVGYTGSVFLLGFVIPVVQLLYWAALTFDYIFTKEFVSYIWNSTFVASVSAAAIVVIAILVANYTRMAKGIVPAVTARLTILGYSIPGAVIAVGVISFFIFLDEQLMTMLGASSSLVLSTSVVMLLFAYVIRFMAIGYNSIESGFEKVGMKFTEASRTLGMGWTETFFKVDVKLIRPAIFSGFILVFVDILKELPLTLILRPFNFETLSTMAYRYANDEMIQEAAVASLFIVMVSGIAMYLFHTFIEKEPN